MQVFRENRKRCLNRYASFYALLSEMQQLPSTYSLLSHIWSAKSAHWVEFNEFIKFILMLHKIGGPLKRLPNAWKRAESL